MKKNKHGGRRKGAGRKPSGRESFTIRCKPEAWRVFVNSARYYGYKTPGKYLEVLQGYVET